MAFATWLRREKPDTLLLTSWRSTFSVTAAARMAGVRRVVMRLGIVRPFPGPSPRAWAIARGVDALIVNSEEIRSAWLNSQRGSPAHDVYVVMNAIREISDRRAELRARLRAQLDVPEGTLLVGGAGHLAPRKGFDLLLQAFAAAGLPNAQLVIIGDGEHARDLRALADTLGIASTVHWPGHRDDAAEMIGGLDLFALTSHNEGMANVMLEAMAAGVPVVASDISGVRKAIGPGETIPPAGWVFPSGNYRDLADRLREVGELIRDSSPEVNVRVEEATSRIQRWFGLDRMIDECEAILFPTRPVGSRG
jgi:glycosyltransferase involved in cell wall biosynthesis